MRGFFRKPAAQYGVLFLAMAVWSWLGLVSFLATADRNPAMAVPIGMVLSAVQYVGFAVMGKTWKKGVCWVAGDGVGSLLGFYFP